MTQVTPRRKLRWYEHEYKKWKRRTEVWTRKSCIDL